MEKNFNKLVRDNIPNIIESNGDIPVTRVLNDDEYKEELYKKLFEEVNEVISAKTSNEIIDELADVYEVISSIAEVYDSSISLVEEKAKQKRLKRGGFNKKIFLEKTYDK